MIEKRIITHREVQDAAVNVARKISEYHRVVSPRRNVAFLYGVPRGGVAAAYAVAQALKVFGRDAEVVDDVSRADYVIDDLIDSGATAARFVEKEFYSLFKRSDFGGQWLVFPWEVGDHDASKEDIIVRQLQAIGEDVTRGGLLETPARVVKAWGERFWGYGQDPADVLKVFEDGAERCDQMVVVSNIPIYSKCEHHLEDIFGVVHIGYIPSGKVVGLSKLARVADIFARRCQVQERLTNQIADALDENLSPQGVGVVIEARHMCMESRGVRTPGTTTTTSALRGDMLSDAATRAEFLSLVRAQPRSHVL